mgnify:CR=1 FL=1
MFSSESDEFEDSETGARVFTVRLFDEDLPEITTEEEVEILYKIPHKIIKMEDLPSLFESKNTEEWNSLIYIVEIEVSHLVEPINKD